LHTVEHPDEVDFQNGPEVLDGFVLDELPRRNAGIVHQAVEAAELGEAELHGVRPLPGIGDVQVDVTRLCPKLIGQVLADIVEQVPDHDIAAARDNVACEGGAETSSAAADDDDFFEQSRHQDALIRLKPL
jgi:hypothetical protein